jgi:hypothetical protein
VIEDQKIAVGRTTTTKRAKKSRAKKPANKYSFIQHQNGDYSSLKRGRGEVKSRYPLFLFQISFIYFLFYQMQRWAKTNMQWKRRKENDRFGGERENSNVNGGRMMEKKMG